MNQENRQKFIDQVIKSGATDGALSSGIEKIASELETDALLKLYEYKQFESYRAAVLLGAQIKAIQYELQKRDITI